MSAPYLAPLHDELDQLGVQLRELAYQIVAQVFLDELARREAAEAEAEAEDDDDRTDSVSASPTRTASAPPARGQWTRELVVEELSQWLLGGHPVEAAYLIRHRQRALVTNAKKFFGRFDAALNAANLHLSRIYPEGIPSKKATKAP
ncbi:MAG TPA: hypothetical protein VHE35_11075 [Kofleriaceae bacterium]|nr:hypothetical protein [Kofleriaceae bacterium]